MAYKFQVGAARMSGSLTQEEAFTVVAGGATVTAGGLTVSAGTSALQVVTATTVDATTDFTVDGLVLTANTITNDEAMSIVTTTGAMTLDSGGAINLDPADGNAIVLDGTISVDAGVVTGATSITSTAFVGALTGEASTVATIAGLAPNTATTAAAQTNITSLGTLTALAVDTVSIDANTITSTSDSLFAITAKAGQSLGLEDMRIDAGAVTGLSSVTSTAFVGGISGGTVAGSTGTFSGILTTDDTTQASAIGTAALVCDGGASVAFDLLVGDDIKLLSNKAKIDFGASGEISLKHVQNKGLKLEANGLTAMPIFEIKNTNADATGGTLKMHMSSSSPADADVLGNIDFAGYDSGGGATTYARILAKSDDVTAGQEEGSMEFHVAELDGTLTKGMSIVGLASDGNVAVDITTHNGTGGLKLGGTLVTATAAEINYLDITTLGTAENSKAFTRAADGSWTAAGSTCANLGTVSGATSITSTAFVGDITGDITGNADTATKIASITNSNIVQLTESQTLTNKTLTAPTLTTPALGTPSALVLTNATALPAAQVAQGTMASGMVLVAPALGTPASGVLTNCTALPAAQVAQGTMASGMVLVAPALGTPASGVLTNCTGTAASLTAGTATLATTFTCSDNESTNEDCPIVFVDGATGAQGAETDGDLHYNPSTGTVTATVFVGALTGNVTGNASGTALTVTQAAQTAITSVGTLTGLDVDNVNINGNTVSCSNTGGLKLDPSNGTTGTSGVALAANVGDAWNIEQAGSSYVKFATTIGSELITFGKECTFAAQTIANLGTVEAATSITSTKFDGIIGSDTARAGTFSTLDCNNGAFAINNLASSAVTIGATSVSLGSTVTAFTGLTDLDCTAGSKTFFDTVGAGNTLTFGVVGSTMVVAGNLQVHGSSSIVHTDNYVIKDPVIGMGYGTGSHTGSAADRGILMGMSGENALAMIWNEGNDRFEFGRTAGDPTDTDFTMASFESIKAKSFIGDIAATVTSGSNGATLSTGLTYFDAISSAASCSLPATADLSVGDSVRVKAGSDVSTTISLTIDRTTAAHTIDGAASVILESPYAAVEFVYVKLNTWRIM